VGIATEWPPVVPCRTDTTSPRLRPEAAAYCSALARACANACSRARCSSACGCAICRLTPPMRTALPPASTVAASARWSGRPRALVPGHRARRAPAVSVTWGSGRFPRVMRRGKRPRDPVTWLVAPARAPGGAGPSAGWRRPERQAARTLGRTLSTVSLSARLKRSGKNGSAKSGRTRARRPPRRPWQHRVRPRAASTTDAASLPTANGHSPRRTPRGKRPLDPVTWRAVAPASIGSAHVARVSTGRW